MKMKYLLFGGLALVGISALGAKKGFEISDTIPQLQTALAGIRKLGFRSTGLTLVVDVLVKNPTNKALNFASLGAVKVAKLHIFDRNGSYIGRAEPNLTALSIPANGQIVLKDMVILGKFTDIWNFISGGGFSLDPNEYTVQAEINALGKTLTI